MKFQTENKLMTMFSVSSLTDVVFLLLIFFLLSSSFVVQPGIKVQLPSAEQTPAKSETQIILTITEKGQYFVNNQRVAVADLGTTLLQQLGENKDKLVVINADKTLSLQRAVEVMDIAKHVGASRFLIATNQEKEPGRRKRK